MGLFTPISLVGAVAMNDGSTTNNTVAAATIPAAAQPGDVGIAILSDNVTEAFTATPSGWTVLSAITSTLTNLFTVVYVKDLVAGDAGSSASWTAGSGGRYTGLLAVYRGTNGTPGIVLGGPTTNATGGTALTRPAVTAAVPFSYVVGLWAMRVATVAPAPTLTYAGTETFDLRSRTAQTTSPNYTLELSHLTTDIASTSEATSAATASATTTNFHTYSLALSPALQTSNDLLLNRARYRAANW